MIAVAFVQSRFDRGGAERMMQDLVRSLDRTRFAPVLVALDRPGTIGDELAAEGIPVLSGLARGTFDPAVGGRLNAALISAGVRVVYTTDSAQPLFWCGQVRRRRKDLALVVGFHSTGNRAKRLQHAVSRRSALPVADRVVALAPSHRAFLADRFGISAERFVEIANGVDVTRFHPARDRAAERRALGFAPETPLVGIVAALRPEKRHSLFLEVATRTAAEFPETRFLIVGDGPERALLEREAAPLGDRVRILGARSDVPEIQRVLDVAMLTSDAVVETLPLALMEAAASAVPVVATRVGSVDAIVADGLTGTLVPPGDAGALASRLAELLRDPSRRAIWGAAARRRAEEHFDRSQMVARYERLFTDLAS